MGDVCIRAESSAELLMPGEVYFVETTTEADLDRIYAVNVKGLFLCSQAVVPRMVSAGGGVILNLASIASLIGLTQ